MQIFSFPTFYQNGGFNEFDVPGQRQHSTRLHTPHPATSQALFPWFHPVTSLNHLGHMSFSEAGKWDVLIGQTWVMCPVCCQGLQLALPKLQSQGVGRSGFPKEDQGGLLPEKGDVAVGQLKPFYLTQLRTQVSTGI